MANSAGEVLFLHKIFNASLEGILLVSDDGVILRANPASEQMFGYDSGDLVQKKVETLIPDSFKKNHKSHRIKYTKKPKARRMGQDLDLWGLKKDGSQFPLEISLSPTEIDAKQVVIAFVIDITERMSAKQALLVSESRMAEAQRIAHVGNWYWNLQTNERSWSDEFYRICGLPPGDERLNAETIVDFIHPEDRENAIKAVKNAIEDQVPYYFEKRIIRSNGSVRYVIANGRVNYNEHGEPLHMFGTMQDVTEQKEISNSLYQSNRKLNTLINNLPGVVYRCENNLNWTMESISEGCYDITGYQRNELTDGLIQFGEIILEEDRMTTWNAVEEALKNKESFDVKYRIRNKNGKVRYLWEQGIGIFDQNGTVECLEGFIWDITEQKEIELKLRAEKDINKAILEAMPDMLFIQDFKGVYIDYFASESEELFMPIEAFIGKNMTEVLPPHVFDVVKKAHDLAISSGELQVVEYSITDKTGEHFFEARAVHLNHYGVLTIVRDISIQKIAERQLIESETKNRAILKGIPDLITVLDGQGNYLEVHAPHPYTFSVPIEKIIGKTIYDFHPKERCDRILKAFSDSEKTKEVQILVINFEVAKELRCYEVRIVSKGNDKFLAITRDITAKKALENVLQIRNRALQCASSGIIITDAQQPNTPIIYVNQALLNTTGYKSTDFIGKNSRFLQGKDKDQEEIKIMSSAIKNGKACNVVLRNYRKDGSQYWNEISLTPIYDSKHILTHFISVQNDITARKKEEFYKSASNYVMDMIIQHKPLKQIGNKIIETIETVIPNCMGSILLLNEENKTLYKLSTLNIPKPFSDAIEGINIGKNMGSCGTASYLKKEVIVTDIRESPLWKDFKELALVNNLKSCWSFPIFSSKQEVLGTFAIYSNTVREPLAKERDIIQDVTRVASIAIEQHNINNALNESNERLEAYTEQLENKVAERTNILKEIVQKLTESNLSLEDQIQETKVAENKVLRSKQLLDDIFHNFPRGFVAVVDSNFTIVLIEGEELDELSFEDLVNKATAFDDVIGVPEDIKALIKDNMKKTFKGEQLSFEISFQDRYYLVNTTPLYNRANKIDRVLLIHNNITLQKKAEHEILNTLKKEQELSELKSRFISMASHEFRTPLSVILSSATLIEKQNEVGKEDKRIKYVSKIKSNVKNLVVILNDFLSLSKLQEGKVIAQPIAFDLVDFSKSLIEEIDGIKKNGQIITLHCDHSIIEVFLDSKLLKLIIYNLLSNAIKYSEENKEVIIKIEIINDLVCVEIKDHGIGIPIEDQNNMFQRFYRATNVSNIQGTGLGLNIVKQYTELMGGTISFKSQLNEGSSFYIAFPYN